MRTVLKFKWPITVAVLAITIILFFISPNLTKQAEEAGTFQLSEDASSQIAAKLLAEAGVGDETISVVLPLESALDDSMREQINSFATEIENLGKPVKSVLNPFESEELEQQLVSEDQKTVLIPVTVDVTNEDVIAVADEIQEKIIPTSITAFVTGEAIINNDVNNSAQDGLKQTELITVVLIFLLLLAVFRSVVTPFIPLLTVGISYLLSQAIVAFLIDLVGFPVSNYTQIFLVVILFGIGTDYCILLLSRYKEELSAGNSVEDAIVNTYKTAGRTLLISGLAVFIGFAAIGFADFPIFKSGVAVAVGIAVLLLVIYTIVPFFMAVLKDKLFWPSKNSATHHDSKFWIWMSKLSVNRPLLSMLVVAIITVPLLLTYENSVSYNTVDEIGAEYESVKGLRAIENGFGKGDALPVKVVFKSDSSFLEESTVPYVEVIAKDLEKIDGVGSVRSITRPTGEVIEELFVNKQVGLLSEGLTKAQTGLGEIHNGLSEIESGLTNITEQLNASNSRGLADAATGLGQLNQQLSLVTQGLQQTQNIPQTVGALTAISEQLNNIQTQLSGAATQSGAMTGQLREGLQKAAEGIGAANAGLVEVQHGLTDAISFMDEISNAQSVGETGLFIPKDTLQSEEFSQVIDRYTFDKGKGMTMEVVLTDDPYSTEAIQTVHEIKEAVQRSVKGTPLEGATIAYGGISSINNDLNEVSSNDFTKTVTLMLVSLFIVLIILFRSIIIPLYMVGSLLLTYFASISIAELIFINGLHYDGLSWAVPFFGFVMLIALGVDYSIFLLDRFREESMKGLTVGEAIRTSMAKMGTVIMTAAIILSGTFAAMLPSGVLSLLQISSIVIIGLLLYGIIILPLLIPAITVSFNNGVWWPFMKRKE